MKDFTGKKISVLGDSISTFKGVTKDDPNTFYGRVMCEKGGFAGVQDTWWARVIAALGGTVEKINAYSGSCIADGYVSAAARARPNASETSAARM